MTDGQTNLTSPAATGDAARGCESATDGASSSGETVGLRRALIATVSTCVVIGLLSAVEVYAAQLVWPASQPFPDVDTAFVHVAGSLRVKGTAGPRPPWRGRP